jgi:hypothetical protein
MSRFQPRGTIQTIILNEYFIPSTPADLAFAAAQQTNFVACNNLTAGISFFLPNGNPDVKKTDYVQAFIQAIYVVATEASLAVAGISSDGQQNGWAGLTDWAATLLARKAALATLLATN